jgi:hypothetical protein
MGKRSRKLTAKGADYEIQLERKKAAALARIEAKRKNASTAAEMDELSELFKSVSTSTDVDDLTSMMVRLGGRRRKTYKKRKNSRTTRKH